VTAAAATTTTKKRRPSTKKKKKKEKEPEEQVEDVTPKFVPRTKGWTSDISMNTLDKKTSIIVLRDAETNRTAQIPKFITEQLTAGSVEHVAPDALIAMVEENRNAPGQEEVNKHLDTLRPKGEGHAQEKVSLSQSKFVLLSDEIANGFNHIQLSRYITIHRGHEMLREQESTEKDNSGRGGVTLPRSTWVPVSPVAKKDSRQRGKYGLVNFIMRSVWGLEVYEEKEQVGAMNVALSEARLALLVARGMSIITAVIPSEN